MESFENSGENIGENSAQTFIVVNPSAKEGHFQKINDRSGESNESRLDAMKKEICEALGDHSAQIALTTADDHGSKMIRQALKSGAKRIVVVGGDGTLNEAVQGFFEEDSSSVQPVNPEAILMVMPGGRGDDFFKTMLDQRFYRSHTAWKLGLELLAKGSPKTVDVGRIRWLGSQMKPRYFINIASFGFAGMVMEKVLEQKGLKKTLIGARSWTYGLQGLLSIQEYHPIRMKITVDDKDFYQGGVHIGFVMNGRFNTGGILWDADTRPDDGLFHVMVIEPSDLATTLGNSAKIFFELQKSVVGAHRTSGKKVKIELEGSHKPHRVFEVDGDLFEDQATRGTEYEILPGAIRVHRY